ncbi:hypothetical protein GGR93_003633 [Sulfitobacter noctilucicola]|uniref:Uncharacterized protein n=1 Tax=Sulfitobacter noctilucicola TaxID=1342301 RepID=A0A7W6Q7F8_9RHOB|nr:hypothetical protein [Sulfitobacter noctilucicola]
MAVGTYDCVEEASLAMTSEGKKYSPTADGTSYLQRKYKVFQKGTEQMAPVWASIEEDAKH